MVCSKETLANNLIKAGTGPVFEPDVDVRKVLYETLRRDGPCPSIVVGDHVHWRLICIDARNKTILLTRLEELSSSHIVLRLYKQCWTSMSSTMQMRPEQVSTGAHRLQHDSHNCGIWAIWLMEQWMQYWSQGHITQDFESWCVPHARAETDGQLLRQHYWGIMKPARKPGSDGKTAQEKAEARSNSRMPQHPMVFNEEEEENTSSEIPNSVQDHNARTKQAKYVPSSKSKQAQPHTIKTRVIQGTQSLTRLWSKAKSKPASTKPSAKTDLPECKAKAAQNAGTTGSARSTAEDSLKGQGHSSPLPVHSRCKSKTSRRQSKHRLPTAVAKLHTKTCPAKNSLLHPKYHKNRHAAYADSNDKQDMHRWQSSANASRATEHKQADEAEAQHAAHPHAAAETRGTMFAWLKTQNDKTRNNIPDIHKPLPEQPAPQVQTKGAKRPQETQPQDADDIKHLTDKRQRDAGQFANQTEELTICTWNVMGTITVLNELNMLTQRHEPWIIVGGL